MTEERKIQLEVEVGSTRAKTGFDQVEQRADEMGKSVAQSATVAGKAIDGIGAGADSAAKKVDGAQRSLIGSIERTTAAMQAGSKSSSEYYKVLAEQRGVDPKAIEPYLAQLRAVEAAQGKTSIANKAGSESFQAVGVSAGQTAAALRQLPAQFSDIVVSLQGGQKPISVFLQQGSQIKDSFGGAGAALKAISGYVVGLVNPFTVAAVAAAGLAFAYHQGAAETDAYNKALAVTNNAAGATAGSLSDMARNIAKVTGSQGGAAEALAGLVSTGKVGAENLQRFGAVAVQVQQIVGRSVAETTADFADLGKAPVAALEKLNEKYHFLTSATYAQVKALEDQGKAADAANLAQSTYADAIAAQKDRVLGALSDWERGWIRIKKISSEAVDSLLGAGRGTTDYEKITAALRQRDQIEASIDKAEQERDVKAADRFRAQLTRNTQIIASLRAKSDAEKAAAKAEEAASNKRDAGVQFDKIGSQFKPRIQQRDDEVTKVTNLGVLAGKTKAEIDTLVKEVKQKYSDLNNAGIVALEAQQKLEAEKLTGSIADLESKHKQALVGDAAYFAAKRDLQLKGIDSEIALTTKQAQIAGGKQDLSERNRYLGDLAVLEQRRKNIIQGASNSISEIYTASAKAITAEVTKWQNATLSEQALLQDETALFGKSAEARSILSAQIKVDADVRKFLADEQAKNHHLLPDEIAQLYLEADARKKNIAAIMGEQQARSGAEQLRLENRKFAVEYIADEQTRAAAIREIDADLWRERIRLAGEGTEAQKLLQTEFDQWYANRQMAPVLDYWKGVIGNLDTDFREGFRNMLTGGENAWHSFSKSIGNTLKTTLADVLYQTFIKKYVVSIVTSAAGAISGQGVSNALQGAGTAADALNSGNLLSAGSSALGASALYSAGSAFASGFSGSLVGAAAGLGPTVAGSATGIGATVGGTGGLMAGAGSALAAIPVAGWIVLAAAAIYALAEKYTKGETRSGGQYGYSFDGSTVVDNRAGATKTAGGIGATFLQGPSGGDPYAKEAQDAINATVGSINATLKAVGSAATLTGFSAGYESSGNDHGGVFAGGVLSTGQSFGESGRDFNSHGSPFETTSTNSPDAKTAIQNFALDLQQATIQALQSAIDVPKVVADVLRGVDAESLTSDASTALLNQVGAIVTTVNGFRDSLKQLPFEALKNISFDAAAGLIAAAGGLDKLSANLSSYYDNFYTSEEKTATLTANVKAVFASIGAVMPDLTQGAEKARAEYRKMVDDSFKDTSPAGQAATATLLAVNAAFAQLTPAAEAADKAITSAGDSLAATNAEYQKQIDALTKAALPLAQQRALEVKGMDASTLALYQQLEALNAQAAAAKSAADAAQVLANTNKSVQDQIDALIASGQSLDQQRQAELVGLDASTAALKLRLFALQDEKTLSEAATKAAKDAADASAALAKQQQEAFATAVQAYNAAVGNVASATQTAAGAYQAFVSTVSAATETLSSAGRAITDKYSAALAAQQTADKAVADARATLTEAYVQSSDKVAAAQQKVIDVNKAIADSARKLAGDLNGFLDTFSTTEIAGASRREQLAARESQFAGQAALAGAGDATAAASLPEIATALLTLKKGLTTDPIELALASAAIRSKIADVAAAVGAKAGPAGPDSAQDQVSAAMKDLASALEEQKNLADAVATAGASLTAANTDILAGYKNAVAAQSDAGKEVKYWSDVLTSVGVTFDATSNSLERSGQSLVDQYHKAEADLAKANSDLSAANLIKGDLELRQTTALESFADQVAQLNSAVAALAAATIAKAAATAAISTAPAASAFVGPIAPGGPASPSADMTQPGSLSSLGPVTPSVSGTPASNVETINLLSTDSIVRSWYENNPNAIKNPGLDDISYWVNRIAATNMDAAKLSFSGTVAAITGTSPLNIRAFEGGGDHFGGVRLVGEKGPELEFTGPSRIWSADQTRRILGGGSDASVLAKKFDLFLVQIGGLRAEVRAVAGHTAKTSKDISRVLAPEGDALNFREPA